MAHNWHKAVQKTPLKAKYSELSFGNTEKVQGLQLKVPNISGDHYVNLRGKMDRVDLAQIPDQNEIMAQVVDYKSSAKKFNLGLFTMAFRYKWFRIWTYWPAIKSFSLNQKCRYHF
ncbi:PD-(D/E)XK nuclease family protein [Lactobacillus sp. R2/2]|nr:PD-(D/E)XK nuclease family protein [Lactobacillus sp. R2/2]